MIIELIEKMQNEMEKYLEDIEEIKEELNICRNETQKIKTYLEKMKGLKEQYTDIINQRLSISQISKDMDEINTYIGYLNEKCNNNFNSSECKNISSTTSRKILDAIGKIRAEVLKKLLLDNLGINLKIDKIEENSENLFQHTISNLDQIANDKDVLKEFLNGKSIDNTGKLEKLHIFLSSYYVYFVGSYIQSAKYSSLNKDMKRLLLSVITKDSLFEKINEALPSLDIEEIKSLYEKISKFKEYTGNDIFELLLSFLKEYEIPILDRLKDLNKELNDIRTRIELLLNCYRRKEDLKSVLENMKKISNFRISALRKTKDDIISTIDSVFNYCKQYTNIKSIKELENIEIDRLNIDKILKGKINTYREKISSITNFLRKLQSGNIINCEQAINQFNNFIKSLSLNSTFNDLNEISENEVKIDSLLYDCVTRLLSQKQIKLDASTLDTDIIQSLVKLTKELENLSATIIISIEESRDNGTK
ncbi:MAG: hypothetical protein QXY87_11060 [Saccharolobus sp.]|uniref:hypothetical protein n=1 Tax=Saccharolobus TaxID=2100760 RepID=UPI001F0DF3A7|nr:hypothetical protein [Saccharolobus shibatae]MCH4816156.1 hypothetical protein [Saccharolobus shibatae]